jgi:beta-lactamase superfamily II metal-dependent hydrolase
MILKLKNDLVVVASVGQEEAYGHATREVRAREHD